MALGTGTLHSSGPVAQWSEQATHNRSVAGSIPARPTASIVGVTESTVGVTDIQGSRDRRSKRTAPRPAGDRPGRRTSPHTIKRTAVSAR